MTYELEQLKEFIRSELKKGYDPKTIESTLASSGFPRAEIRKAFSTLNKKTAVKEEKFEVKLPKVKKPGFFSTLFAKKPKIKKPAVKKAKKKPKPAPKPKKKRPGVLTKFFFKEISIKKPIKKITPKKLPARPAPKIEKPKKPGFFKTLFARKPKPIKTEVKKQKIKPKPVPAKPKKHIKLPKITLPKIHLPTIKIPYLKRITLASFLIFFFIAVGLIIWAFPASCATESCFIKHANKCEAVTFSNIIEGTILKYEANNCVLKKTVMEVAPDEAEEVKQDFLRKSMYCVYRENDFSPLYVNTISGMLNTCEGELREAIQRYII